MSSIDMPQRTERLGRAASISASISSLKQVGDDDARLVQHDMAEADAFGERSAVEADRPASGRAPSPGRVRRFRSPVAIISAMHHGDRFERLDLVVAVVALGALFCTTRTPSVRPARSTGTPRKEW